MTNINFHTTKSIEKGISLIEILIVITIFAGLGILIAGSIILTLQGSQKSAALVRARENLDYSLSIIERQIRGAKSISPCPNPDPKTVAYLDQDGNPSSFTCVNTGANNSFIASGSANVRITSDGVKLTTCSFMCSLSVGSNQPVVSVDLAMQDASASGLQSASVSATTQIFLRNY